MTLEGSAIPLEIKPVKSASRSDDSQKETYQCACKKGGACHRDAHLEGNSCEQSVTLSKSNRHKVCNQCRKNKNKQKSGENLIPRDREHRVVPITVLPGVTTLENSFLAIPLPHTDGMPSVIPNIHLDMGGHSSAHVTSLLNQSSSMSHSHMDRSSGDRGSSSSQSLNGKMQCACDKGGNCSRIKHAPDQPCDRTVTITKNDKHTRCKGCRYLKKRRSGTAASESSGAGIGINISVPSHSRSSMGIVAGPVPTPQLLSMSSGAVPMSHAVPLSHHDLNHL
jgi:hypothetical protein